MSTFEPDFGYDEIYNNAEIKIKKRLKDVMPEDAYFKWIDNFVFEVIDNKKIIIAYYGDDSLKEFNKMYKDTVFLHIGSVLGDVKKIKIYSKNSKNVKKSTVKAKKYKAPKNNTRARHNFKVANLFVLSLFFLGITAFVAILGGSYISNRTFKETFYTVSSLKVNDQVRMIQISDLHSSQFGQDNAKLIERVQKLKPDLVMLTGDCVDADDASVENVINLCTSLVKISPVYYIYGNNEVEKYYDVALNQTELDKKYGFTDATRDPSVLSSEADDLEKALEKIGVDVLKNEIASLTVGTTNLDIFGVLTSNPSSFWSYAGESFYSYLSENENNIKITAIHEPVVFSEFTPDFWGDVSVCGHTHGGFVKVPVIGPLYTHEGGIFPERKGDLVYGRYEVCGRPVIVSSGLDNKNFFRINNEPELVIIDINRF